MPAGRKQKRKKKRAATQRKKKAIKGRRGGGVVRRAINTIAKHPGKVAGAVAAAAALAGGAHALMTGASTLPQDDPGWLIVDKGGRTTVAPDGAIAHDSGPSVTPLSLMPAPNRQSMLGNVSRIDPNFRPRYRSKEATQARAAGRAALRAKLARDTAAANTAIPGVY